MIKFTMQYGCKELYNRKVLIYLKDFFKRGPERQWAQRAARSSDIGGRAEPVSLQARQGTGIGNRDSRWTAKGQRPFKTHKEKWAFRKYG
jgi:hypothetical protein